MIALASKSASSAPVSRGVAIRLPQPSQGGRDIESLGRMGEMTGPFLNFAFLHIKIQDLYLAND
jgi:hypothetical protein